MGVQPVSKPDADDGGVVPTFQDLPAVVDAGCGVLLSDDPDQDGGRSRLKFCVDGTTCGRQASAALEIGGSEVAVCGGHHEEAVDALANVEGVVIVEREPTSDPDAVPEDPMNRSADDYAVAIPDGDGDDDLERCAECQAVLVPDGDGGHTCPRCAEVPA